MLELKRPHTESGSNPTPLKESQQNLNDSSKVTEPLGGQSQFDSKASISRPQLFSL